MGNQSSEGCSFRMEEAVITQDEKARTLEGVCEA